MFYLKACPQCSQRLKFPLDKGRLQVRCPACGYTFTADPDDPELYKAGSFYLPQNQTPLQKLLASPGLQKAKKTAGQLRWKANSFLHRHFNFLLKRIPRPNPYQGGSQAQTAATPRFDMITIIAFLLIFFFVSLMLQRLFCYSSQAGRLPVGTMNRPPVHDKEVYPENEKSPGDDTTTSDDKPETADSIEPEEITPAPSDSDDQAPPADDEFKDTPFLHEGIPQAPK